MFVNSRWSYRIFANLGSPWNFVEIVYDFLNLNFVVCRQARNLCEIGGNARQSAGRSQCMLQACPERDKEHWSYYEMFWQTWTEKRCVGCLEHDPSPAPLESCMIQITAQVGDHLRWEEDAAHWGNGFLEQLIICARQPWKCNRTLNYLLKSNIRFFRNLFCKVLKSLWFCYHSYPA